MEKVVEQVQVRLTGGLWTDEDKGRVVTADTTTTPGLLEVNDPDSDLEGVSIVLEEYETRFPHDFTFDDWGGEIVEAVPLSGGEIVETVKVRLTGCEWGDHLGEIVEAVETSADTARIEELDHPYADYTVLTATEDADEEWAGEIVETVTVRLTGSAWGSTGEHQPGDLVEACAEESKSGGHVIVAVPVPSGHLIATSEYHVFLAGEGESDRDVEEWGGEIVDSSETEVDEPSLTPYQASLGGIGRLNLDRMGTGVVSTNRLVSAPEKPDATNPEHYQFPGGAEVIDISEWLSANGAQAFQYVARATRVDGKTKGDPIEDLRKARWFIDREIARLEAAS